MPAMAPERWQKIERLYQAALERNEQERAAYLQNACGGDDRLRTEVESLLAHGKTADGWSKGGVLRELAAKILDHHTGGSLVGAQLGPYQLSEMVGAGGMGEVYRARDTRLNRTVAIKVVPAHLAGKAELRERFEREAKTVASLNHPHVCSLYDVGHQDGTSYLVMEYLEGETLAELLRKGPLPLPQALGFAIEIADALDKAHRQGITHRDLKPGNIMITKSGTKLLDFGLAKLRQETETVTPFSQRPTDEKGITAEGTILGTLQYMAPEQIEGREVDARTDIFALGVVIYEMATGKRAFEGKTSASVMAKILETDPPPMSSLQPLTPAALDRLVRKCLAKPPEKRWQNASDLCDELKWIGEGGPQTGMPATVPAERFGKRSLLAGAGALLLGVVLAGLAFWTLKPAVRSQPQPVTRTVISLPPEQRPPSAQDLYPLLLALSPDGTRLVYAGSDRTARVQLYLRPLDSTESRPISGTEGAYNPFFSPDGQWLGFFQSGGILKKVSINGGAAVTLANSSPAPSGASWASHGTIIFGTVSQPLQQISDEGGIPQALTRLEQGDLTHRWPDVLPGGKAVLFDTGGEASQIAVYSLTTGKKRNLGLAGTHPRYASSGHLLYMQGSTLMAVPFDTQRLEIRGTAVPVIEGVMQGAGGAGQYSVSRTGTLAYISGTAGTTQRNLVWVARNGLEQVLPAPPRAYGAPRLSPDGRRVAVEVENQIWIYDLARDTLSRLTFEGTVNQDPTWTPDGKRIAFRSNKGGVRSVFWISADGSGGLEQLSTGRLQIPTSFSRNGQALIFHELNPATQRDIWLLHMDNRKAEPFLQTQFNEGGGVLSPDGRWLAYVSNESGQPEIYVQPYPGPGGKWQVSTAGGTGPVWSPTGKELFYRSGDKMMAVEVATQPTFSAGKPKALFEGRYFDVPFPLIGTAYDVSPDGQKFLMVKDTEPSTSTSEINLVQNWFEELKRRVPPGTK